MYVSSNLGFLLWSRVSLAWIYLNCLLDPMGSAVVLLWAVFGLLGGWQLIALGLCAEEFLLSFACFLLHFFIVIKSKAWICLVTVILNRQSWSMDVPSLIKRGLIEVAILQRFGCDWFWEIKPSILFALPIIGLASCRMMRLTSITIFESFKRLFWFLFWQWRVAQVEKASSTCLIRQHWSRSSSQWAFSGPPLWVLCLPPLWRYWYIYQ